MKQYRVFLWVLLFCVGTEKINAQDQDNTPFVSMAGQKMDFVRLHPIAVMDVGVGVGAGYERLFGQKKNFGLILPGFLILESNSNPGLDTSSNRKAYDAYFYFAPGFKFYPKGHNKLTYAFGPSFMFGFCNSKFEISGPYPNGDKITVKYARKRFGVLINNYVTYEISKLFDLGLEGGIGMTYFNKESYSGPESYAGNSTTLKSVDISGQFSLSIGCKF